MAGGPGKARNRTIMELYDYATCSICGKGFTAAQWNDRHTDPRNGEDCHVKCCPNPACVADRAEKRRLKRQNQRQPKPKQPSRKAHRKVTVSYDIPAQG